MCSSTCSTAGTRRSPFNEFSLALAAFVTIDILLSSLTRRHALIVVPIVVSLKYPGSMPSQIQMLAGMRGIFADDYFSLILLRPTASD